MMPLVTVALPAYRHEAFIEETMLSVYHQTYDRIELVIVDDRSPDETLGVVQWLASRPWFRARFERVHVVQNEANVGAHASLNRAMALAEGEYISLLNSDDLYAPSRISRLVEVCRSSNVECAFTNVEPVNDAGHSIFSDSLAQSIALNPRRVIENLPSLSFGFLRYQLSSSTGNIFLSRELQQKIGGFINLRYCHDWDYMLRLISKVEPVYIDEPLYRYRFHDGNSFRSLSDVAEAESEVVLSRYYLQVLLGEVKNRKAPSPYNWPGAFEAIAGHFEVFDLWRQISGDYKAHFRTVDLRHKRNSSVGLYRSRFAALEFSAGTDGRSG